MNVFNKELEIKNKNKAITKAKAKKCKQQALKSIDELEKSFSEKFNTSFMKTILKIPEIGIQKKVNKNIKKQKQRNQIRKIKNNIQVQMSATSIDRCYGLRTSLKKRNESRILLSYETKESLTSQNIIDLLRLT